MDPICRVEQLIVDISINVRTTLEPKMSFDCPNPWLTMHELFQDEFLYMLGIGCIPTTMAKEANYYPTSDACFFYSKGGEDKLQSTFSSS